MYLKINDFYLLISAIPQNSLFSTSGEANAAMVV